MSIAFLFGLFFLLLLIGAPIAIALGASTFVTLVFMTPTSPVEIAGMIWPKD